MREGTDCRGLSVGGVLTNARREGRGCVRFVLCRRLLAPSARFNAATATAFAGFWRFECTILSQVTHGSRFRCGWICKRNAKRARKEWFWSIVVSGLAACLRLRMIHEKAVKYIWSAGCPHLQGYESRAALPASIGDLSRMDLRGVAYLSESAISEGFTLGLHTS